MLSAEVCEAGSKEVGDWAAGLPMWGTLGNAVGDAALQNSDVRSAKVGS